jgi:uncharacterized damage-inducible protein DinB
VRRDDQSEDCLKPHLQTLFRYVAWADRRVLAALRDAPAAHSEGLPLFAHLLAAEHVWLSRLIQEPPRHPVWPTLDLAACEVLLAENEAGYREYLAALADDQVAADVSYTTSQGQPMTSTVLDILTQVITHGPYHRGQIAKIIGRTGGTATNTDYIVFSREV